MDFFPKKHFSTYCISIYQEPALLMHEDIYSLLYITELTHGWLWNGVSKRPASWLSLELEATREALSGTSSRRRLWFVEKLQSAKFILVCFNGSDGVASVMRFPTQSLDCKLIGKVGQQFLKRKRQMENVNHWWRPKLCNSSSNSSRNWVSSLS